ncbi:hypothetical protein KR222_009016 [Zaprionus bogoriensis]|nr:hypothetical protein KR222_009016 [Zaprionus bogoriensis]
MSASTNSISNNNNNNNTNSNNNNNSNGSSDVPEDCSVFKYYMEKCYVLPLELKNDLIYCQRAMRDFLKVHGLVSDVFKEQADADPVQMQRILDELETEVYEINAEQQFLMLRLNDDLDIFYKKLEENNIQTVPELGNEYISSQIVPLIGDASYKICPQSVLTRDNEEMLIRKHFLISQDEDAGVEPLKLSELDDNVPLLLVNPASTTVPAAMAAATTAPAVIPTAILAGNTKNPPASDVPSLQPIDAKCESSSLSGLPTLRPMTTPALVPTMAQSPTASAKREQQRSLLISRSALSGDEQDAGAAQLAVSVPSLPLPLPLQPPPLAVAKQRSPRADARSPLKRSSTSPPPLAPITQTPITTDFEEVAQSRMNLRQALKRARKTKQQPRQFDEEDLELTSDKSPEQSPQLAAVTAPKGKPGKVLEATGTVAAAAPPPPPPPAGAASGSGPGSVAALARKAVQPAASKQYKTRNAYGAGRKPATPPPVVAAQQTASGSGSAAASAAATTAAGAGAAGGSSGSSGSSDDSHQELELEQQRLCASAAQWRDEPRETRVLPAEYGQEHFLGLFRLYTHDMVKKLCQRHSKRKRRTVQNASGVVFHYGQQLAAIDAVRQKKLKADKPEFLLSPKEKRLQAKKAHKANAAAVVAAANRKSKSKTPEKPEDPLGQAELGKQKCKECKKRADNLLTCQSCQGYYHLDCHEDVNAKAQAQLSSRCPQCLRGWTMSGARAKIFS